jgi:cytochrome P450 family 4
MHLLEAAIKETLRIRPPVTEHDRVCMKDCEVNGIKIPAKTRIQMPNLPAHLDEEFFPEPLSFNPHRFLKENADQITPYTWRPFGSGNRVCIGQRFALMEIKIFISKLLYKFKVERTPRTELKYSPGGFFIISYPEIRVALHPRN